MNSSVIIFPGSNCDRDMAVALEKYGFKNTMVWHNDTKIPKSDLVVFAWWFFHMETIYEQVRLLQNQK